MKNLFLALLLAIAAMLPLNLDNAYLRCSSFDTVTIIQNESLRDLASRYTVNETDQAELMEAICEINSISKDTALQKGRKLQIPVLDNHAGTEVARN